MDVTDLVRRVQEYGLDEGEALLYYHLCRLGPSRAAEAAQASGRKRGDAYRLLDRLVEKGFVEKSLERPARYVPRPPEEALQAALAARRSQTEVLEAARADLAALWPRAVAPAAPTKQRFAVHQGRAQVNGVLQRMAQAAREEILIATSADGWARLDGPALLAALEARATQDILVRVLVKRGRQGELPLSGHPGIQVRYADLPTFYQTLLVDAREAAIFVAGGKGVSQPDEAVLWLNSSDVVLAQKALFDQAWRQALSPEDLQQKPPRQLQVLRGRWVRGSRLREMLNGAQSSIVVHAPREEVARWARQGVTDLLAARARAGVAVRVHTPDPAALSALAASGAALLPPTAGVEAGMLTLVDGEQALLALGVAHSPNAVHDEEEWALWSTHADLMGLLGPYTSGAAPAPTPATGAAAQAANGAAAKAVRPVRTEHP